MCECSFPLISILEPVDKFFTKLAINIMKLEEGTIVPYTADVWTCMTREIIAPLAVRSYNDVWS